MKKSIFSRIIALVVFTTIIAGIVTNAPFASFITSFAEDYISSGQCGDNVYWELNEDNILVINGSGKMWDYPVGTSSDVVYDNGSPFLNLSIKTVVIGEGVTYVGQGTFFCHSDIKDVIFTQSVEELGFASFDGTTVENIYCYNKEMLFVEEGEHGLFNKRALTVHGYSNSSASNFANMYNIPFVDLNDESELIKDDLIIYILIKYIEKISGHKIIDYVYLDMDHDGIKEMIAVVLNNSIKYDIWYYSSGSNCYIIDTVDYGDYCNMTALNFSKESHVIINYGNNFGDWQYSKILALHNNNIAELFYQRGRVTVNDDKTILLSTFRVAVIEPASLTETIYYYDESNRQYREKISQTQTYTVKWVNDNGLQIYEEEYEIGEHPAYDTTKWGTPVSSTEGSFAGWAKMPATYNNIVIAEFLNTDNSYSGENGDITYYAIYTDNYVNISWYNGTELLNTSICQVGAVPQYEGKLPTGYYYEYGLKREFLGWTKSDNSEYTISIPDVISAVSSDTVYYAVFSENDPTITVSEYDIYDIDYINQHIDSAKIREWDTFKGAISLKEAVEDSSLEVTHGIWKSIVTADKTVNFDYMGIYGEISANDYNLIMLDMFNSVEGYEKASSIVKESAYSGLKDWAKIADGCLKNAIKGDFSLEKDYERALEDFIEEASEENFEYLVKQIKLCCSKHGMDMSDIAVYHSLLDTYKLSSEIVSGLGTAISTFEDVVENAETIAAYCMYQHMSEEYLDILCEMYIAADNIQENDWEVTDLKNAIKFSMYYYSNPDDAAIKGIIGNAAKNVFEIFAGEFIDDVIENQTVSFVQFIEKNMGNSGMPLHSGETISAYLAGVQQGFKYGVKISDKLFDMNDREGLYTKIKEYGVLSEVMYAVLDNKAKKLLSSQTVDEQYQAAQYYDKAYKMYMFVEIEAASNAAEYEKTFESTAAVKAVITVFNPLNIIYYNWLDKQAIRYIESSVKYAELAKYIKNNTHCHSDYKIGEDKYADVLLDYSLNVLDHKIAIISCPVIVNVYDKTGELIGLLSTNSNYVKSGYETYMYRIEETDSNVVCVPNEYTIEIVGLENGKMSIIGGYVENGEIINAISHRDIEISEDYRLLLDIDSSKITLTDLVSGTSEVFIPIEINIYVVLVYIIVVAFVLLIEVILIVSSGRKKH